VPKNLDLKSISADQHRKGFLRMTSKICPVCVGATGGSRMGVLWEREGTSSLQCEHDPCQATEYVPTNTLK